VFVRVCGKENIVCRRERERTRVYVLVECARASFETCPFYIYLTRVLVLVLFFCFVVEHSFPLVCGLLKVEEYEIKQALADLVLTFSLPSSGMYRVSQQIVASCNTHTHIHTYGRHTHTTHTHGPKQTSRHITHMRCTYTQNTHIPPPPALPSFAGW
jgi:hypothetical protein